jgi:hypothetical protein
MEACLRRLLRLENSCFFFIYYIYSSIYLLIYIIDMKFLCLICLFIRFWGSHYKLFDLRLRLPLESPTRYWWLSFFLYIMVENSCVCVYIYIYIYIYIISIMLSCVSTDFNSCQRIWTCSEIQLLCFSPRYYFILGVAFCYLLKHNNNNINNNSLSLIMFFFSFLFWFFCYLQAGQLVQGPWG